MEGDSESKSKYNKQLMIIAWAEHLLKISLLE